MVHGRWSMDRKWYFYLKEKYMKGLVLFWIVLYQALAITCSAQIDSSKYKGYVNQNDIDGCPSCVEHLIIADASEIRNLVGNAVNIKSITFRNTSIEALPDYFGSFSKLTEVDFENIKSLPKNLEILSNLQSVTIIGCYGTDFSHFFASCKPLKWVRVFESDSLIMPFIPAEWILLKSLNITWSLSKSVSVANCKQLDIAESNFGILSKFVNVENVKKMETAGCCYVEIGELFYKKFSGLIELKLWGPRYDKDNRCIFGPNGHPSNY